MFIFLSHLIFEINLEISSANLKIFRDTQVGLQAAILDLKKKVFHNNSEILRESEDQKRIENNAYLWTLENNALLLLIGVSNFKYKISL
jgi:hypothetical protein